MNRTLNSRGCVTVLLLACLLAAGTCYADPTFGLVTWGGGGDTLGWVSNSFASITSPGSGGNPDAYLLTHFDGVGGPPTVETDTMQNTDAGYTGNYAQYTGLGVNFDFLGYPSSAQSLYFESTAGGGSTWGYDFASTAHAWESQSISLNDDMGWTRLSGSDDFSTALGQVSSIGVTVEHLNTGAPFDYGLDNWQYSDADAAVPEPGTVAMILTAFLSMAGVFQRNIRKSVSGIVGDFANGLSR